MFLDLANCLAKFTVSGQTHSLDCAVEFEKLFQTALSSPLSRKGRPKGQEMRAALLDGLQRKSKSDEIALMKELQRKSDSLFLDEIALEWRERHPNEYKGVEEAIALKRIRERFRKLWATMEPDR